MANKRIVSLLIGIVLLFGMFFPASAADALIINSSHTYQGFNGYVGNDYTSLGISSDVPTPLLNFLETEHNGYKYTLDLLTVEDIEGNTYPYSRAEVLGGASFIFPAHIGADYRVEIDYDTDVIITATADSGGQIDNDDEHGVEVPHSSDITYMITPNDGYRISDVEVDGVSVGAVADYTFTSVRADHDIHAEFAAIPAGSGETFDNDNSPTKYILKYYKNITDDKGIFYMQSVYIGEAATVIGRVPIREGYCFLYWTTNSTGRGTRYLSGDKLKMDRETDLYANWEKEVASSTEANPSVNFNNNPDTGAPAHPSAILPAGLGCLITATIVRRRRRN